MFEIEDVLVVFALGKTNNKMVDVVLSDNGGELGI